MNVILALPGTLPAPQSKDVLIVTPEPQFNDWLWDDTEQAFVPVEFNTRAYRVVNLGKELDYLVHIWVSPSSRQPLAACECAATRICKHIVAVLSHAQENND